ncbi:MAG: hypothetical protein CEE40_04660 [Chloroflexi bacterium B3_Chlor]|nr:MAG: hypothetical protein CEE40_04660 [Chloroflexi bacterium B3_Chlor]
MEPNYTEPAWGLSLWYPTHWISDVQAEGLIFATSAELIEGSEFSAGAAMGVLSAELQTGQTVDEFLQMMLEELYFEDMATSDQQARTIGGQPGLVVTLEGTPERGEYPLRGFMAVAQRGGWGYLFLGVSAAHEWSEYGSTLEEMLRSVRFEEIEHFYASSEMGLTTWYPQDWMYEEDHDQVIFASSEDLLRSGNLEKGAAMLVSTSSLREASLEEWFEDQATELDFESGGPTSKVKPRTVGGQTGLTFRLEGIPTGSETLVKGFMAATEFEDWGYFFLGVSVAEEWAECGPMLEEMLDSVQFME